MPSDLKMNGTQDSCAHTVVETKRVASSVTMERTNVFIEGALQLNFYFVNILHQNCDLSNNLAFIAILEQNIVAFFIRSQ